MLINGTEGKYWGKNRSVVITNTSSAARRHKHTGLEFSKIDGMLIMSFKRDNYNIEMKYEIIGNKIRITDNID